MVSWKDRAKPNGIIHGARNGAAPKENIALFLQGGGALGAYQGGAYAAMSDAGIHPDWVAGISIGAINGAIIAGNPPGERSNKLKAFWDYLDTGYTDALTTLSKGVPHFYDAKLPTTTDQYDFWHVPSIFRVVKDGIKKTSFYDTKPMYDTLKKFIDFDYLNRESPTRLSVGAADVETSKLVYFDNSRSMTQDQINAVNKPGIIVMDQEIKHVEIGPEHIMASGALAPAFPAVVIDGRHYFDGGILPNSNSPTFWAHKTGQLNKDMTVIRVNLWDRNGKAPESIAESTARVKAMQFAEPHIDLSGEVKKHLHTVLKYHPGQSYNLDYDFSHDAIKHNWEAGKRDMEAAIARQRAEETAAKVKQDTSHVRAKPTTHATSLKNGITHQR